VFSIFDSFLFISSVDEFIFPMSLFLVVVTLIFVEGGSRSSPFRSLIWLLPQVRTQGGRYSLSWRVAAKKLA
jgi:hypothetical protein